MRQMLHLVDNDSAFGRERLIGLWT